MCNHTLSNSLQDRLQDRQNCLQDSEDISPNDLLNKAV